MMDNFYDMCKTKFEYNSELYEHSRKQIISDYVKEFSILEGYNDFSYELGEVLDSYIPQKEKPFLQFSLLRIHEKALKVFREASILMENGSASGAMARWRTLFELSVVANIIVKYPDLAEKYILYSHVDDYKVAKKLVDYQEQLKLYNYNMDAFIDIEAKFNNLKTEYGWTGQNSYEWAKNKDIISPNLFQLSKNIGQEHMYAYVDESHMYNHPSTKYLLNDRGAKAPNDSNNYLFSPFEMSLPMQLIACSLHQVNCAVIVGYAKLISADNEQLSRYLEQNKEFPETLIEIIANN